LVQDIISPFAAIADHPEFRRKVAEEAPLRPEEFLTAQNQAQFHILDLHRAIASNKGTEYNCHNKLSCLLTQVKVDETTTDTHKREIITELGGPAVDKKLKIEPPPKKGGPGKIEIDLLKTKGWLEHKTGPIPTCPVIYSEGKIQKARVCVFFICQKLHCRHGNRCNMHHPSSLAKIPANKKSDMKKWISNETTVDFVDGAERE
jgi:hypothetical protein